MRFPVEHILLPHLLESVTHAFLLTGQTQEVAASSAACEQKSTLLTPKPSLVHPAH